MLLNLFQTKTGVPLTDWPLIEAIMKKETIHRILLWQSVPQTTQAARQALAWLKAHRGFHESAWRSAIAAFAQLRSTPSPRTP